jgi:transcriptional regulator with XRE-family HTH domain
MDAADLRRRRKAAGLTQAELAAKLGLHRDFVGLMERGKQAIAERTAFMVSALSPDAESVELDAPLELSTTDPMERMVEAALLRAGIAFVTDRDGGIPENLDFYLPDFDVFLEVKRMHSDRIAGQMARAPNVIAIQGEASVRFLVSILAARRSVR